MVRIPAIDKTYVRVAQLVECLEDKRFSGRKQAAIIYSIPFQGGGRGFESLPRTLKKWLTDYAII